MSSIPLWRHNFLSTFVYTINSLDCKIHILIYNLSQNCVIPQTSKMLIVFHPFIQMDHVCWRTCTYVKFIHVVKKKQIMIDLHLKTLSWMLQTRIKTYQFKPNEYLDLKEAKYKKHSSERNTLKYSPKQERSKASNKHRIPYVVNERLPFLAN